MLLALKNRSAANVGTTATVALRHRKDGEADVIRAYFTCAFTSEAVAAQLPHGVSLDGVAWAKEGMNESLWSGLSYSDEAGNAVSYQDAYSVCQTTFGNSGGLRANAVLDDLGNYVQGFDAVSLTGIGNDAISAKYLSMSVDGLQIKGGASATKSLGAIVFAVTPQVRVITTGETASDTTRTITNAEIDGKTIKFRLPLSNDYTARALVVHTSDDAKYPEARSILTVEGTDSARYVEITTTHFSTFTVSPIGADDVAYVTSATGAFIGSYATLADALAETTDGGTIYLLADTDEAITVSSAKTFNINANGNTYSGTVTAGAGYKVESTTSGSVVTYTATALPLVAKVTLEDGTVTEYYDLNAALYAAAHTAPANQDTTVEILADIVVTGAWTPIRTDTYVGGDIKIIGGDHTITGLSSSLFEHFGTSVGIEIENLTISGATINSASDYAGAFIADISHATFVKLNNCHVVNSSIVSQKYSGGLIGYSGASGLVSITECSVENCNVTGGGSAGGVIGHASGNGGAVSIEDTTVTGNTITGEKDAKTGAVMGTVGNGALSLDATVSGNTLYGGNTELPMDRVLGRIGSAGGSLAITDGTYDGTANYADGSYDSSMGKITISGGSFKTPPSPDAVAEGYIVVDTPNAQGYYTLDGPFVAMIGSNYYSTLADAVAAAPENGEEATTITMIADETLSASVTFPANTKIVLDLNGQTIDNQTNGFVFASGTSPARFTFIVNGDLTVKDSGEGGNISIAKINKPASENSTKAFYVNGKLTVESGTISADYSAAYVNANAEMVVNGGVVHGDSYAININKSNGHVTINGGSVTCSGEATLCTNGNNGTKNDGIFTINGGTIENSGENGTAIYNPNRGTVINVHAPATIIGATAIVMKGGTINIDGGTIRGTGAYGEPGSEKNGFKPTGDAIYVEDTYSTFSNNFKPTVNITGGTFTSANGYAAQYYTQATAVSDSQANGSINVSGTATLVSTKETDVVASTEIPKKVVVAGGSFAHIVPDEYAAEDYSPTTEADAQGMYTVVSVYEAQIVRNGAVVTPKGTLAAMIAAAVDGDTVELLKDIELTSKPISVTKAAGVYTIDGGDHMITVFGNGDKDNCSALDFDGSVGATYVLQNIKFNGKISTEMDAVTTGSRCAVQARNCDLTVQDCEFTVSNGSGIAYRNGNGVLTVTGCTFSGNTWRSIYYNGQDTFAIRSNLFTGNAVVGTGVIYISTGTTGTIADNTFSGNTVADSGNNCAVVYLSTPATVSGNLFTGNTVTAPADKKEAVIVLGGSATGSAITGNAFVGNTLSSGTEKRATVYTGADCDVSGNYWGDGQAPETGTGLDIRVDDGKNPAITVDSYATAYAPNENGRGVTVTLAVFVAQIGDKKYTSFDDAIAAAEKIYPEPTITVIGYDSETMTAPLGWAFLTNGSVTTLVRAVAQIVGGVQYATLQAAVDAAYETTGDVTVKLLSDAAEKVTINQKDGLNLTIDGDSKTMRGQLLVKGMGNDGTRADTLTIKGFAFTGTADDLSESSINGYITFLGGNGENHAHNITVTNCTFASIDTDVAYANRPALRSLSNCLDNITLVDLHAQGLHSFAQFFDIADGVIANCSANCNGGMNLNITRNGAITISDTTIEASGDGKYGIRLQGSGYGVITLGSGTVVSADKVLVAGNTNPQVPLNAGNFIVEDGFYKGNLAQEVQTCTFYITGGYFSEVPDADFIAEGCQVVANTDEATKESYPWTVKPEVTITEADVVIEGDKARITTLGQVDGDKLWVKDESGEWAVDLSVTMSDTTISGVPLPTEENPVKYYTVTKGEKESLTDATVEGNVIGALRVNSALTNTIIAVPWAKIGGGAVTVSNLVATATLTEGDTLQAYDKDTRKFYQWTLKEDKTWEANTTVGGGSADVAEGADTYVIPRGAGVWLTRQNPTEPLYLIGEVAADAAETSLDVAKTADIDGSQSWNLVAPPTAEAFNLNGDKGITPVGGFDRILVPTATVPRNYTYKDGKWGYYKTTVNDNGRVTSAWTADENATVPAGTGFWYLNSSSSSEESKIDWSK